MSIADADQGLHDNVERFDPSLRYHIWYEHWHRYHWVRSIASGRRVLDVACGEGYGSHLLAGVAASVIGIDLDRGTAVRAARTYAAEGLHFLSGDVCALPLASGSVDLAVSFETLEHLLDQETMLNELARVVGEEGIAVISTPDKRVYNPDGEARNDHHVRELSAEEFRDQLGASFPHVRMFGQKFQLLSVIDELAQADRSAEAHYADDDGRPTNASAVGDHVYRVAVCSRSRAALEALDLAGWHSFGDPSGALLAHYEKQLQRLQEQDRYVEERTRELKQVKALAAHLSARLGY